MAAVTGTRVRTLPSLPVLLAIPASTVKIVHLHWARAFIIWLSPVPRAARNNDESQDIASIILYTQGAITTAWHYRGVADEA